MLNKIQKMLEDLEVMENELNDFNHKDFSVSSLGAKANDRLELFRSALQDVVQPLLKDFEDKQIYSIVHNSVSDIIIDGVAINDVIFNEEKVSYRLENREALVEMIQYFTREATGNDLQLMRDDIEYLNSLNDDLVFSSILTNEYVAFSDDTDNFNSICKDILEINSEV